jgi:DNA-binding CsgD family transcriptional regulator
MQQIRVLGMIKKDLCLQIIKASFNSEQIERDILWVKDKDSRFSYCSDKCLEWFEYLYGGPLGDFIGGDSSYYMEGEKLEFVLEFDQETLKSSNIICKEESFDFNHQTQIKPIVYKRPLILEGQIVGTIAQLIHRNFFFLPNQSEPVVLSNKELLVFSLWIFGMSAKEISRLIDVLPATIETHIKRIRIKFNDLNKLQILQILPASIISELHRLAISAATISK